MLEAIADAMRVEYRAIVDAGLLLQLDDARAAVTYDRMVPPASFADYRALARAAGRGHQPRHRRHPDRAHPLPRVLGQLAGTAHHRRAAEGHRRPRAARARRRLPHRGREPAPRARMARLGKSEAAQRQRAGSRRDQPRHQRGRASRAGRRAHRAHRAAWWDARTCWPAPTAASRRVRSTGACIRRSCGRNWRRSPKGRSWRAKSFGTKA